MLLAAKDRPSRQVLGWRPWLAQESKRRLIHRACPVCIDTARPDLRVVTLVSKFPLTLSCPEHGCWLEPAFTLGTFVAWNEPGVRPTDAPDSVVRMDRRTHEALSAGAVSLPRRQVHAGVWFRLLRTVIDELSTPV